MSANRKNILIVTASVGAGHTQAANAVAAAIHRHYPGNNVETVDFMAEENSYFNTLVKETYLKMISLSPNVYDVLYRWSQAPRQYAKVENLMARAMKRTMLRLYRRYRPDMIICTHPFPCGAAAYLRRTRMINVPLVAITTDFAVHQFWVYDEVDLYFVAGREMQDELVARGVPARQVYSSGIPVDPSFGEATDVGAISRDLGLVAEMPVVLVMSGGLGVGPVQDAILSIDACEQAFQIIVVAGNNTLLHRQLEQTAQVTRHQVSVLGYTQRIRELMAVADVLVTKPGALTLSEALALSLPMVLFSPLPGQEEDNASYLVSHGAALWVDGVGRLGEIVSGLLAQPQRLARMRQNAARLGRPQAAAAVAKVISDYLPHQVPAAGI
ncbi:MAG: glycosyltransferase [Negativicutes bacterium]|nr:glycosyltransferase [Negativicutes bacterium]